MTKRNIQKKECKLTKKYKWVQNLEYSAFSSFIIIGKNIN